MVFYFNSYRKNQPKAKLLLYVLLVNMMFISIKCTDDDREPVLPPSQLVVIGEDLSKTFRNFTPISRADLEEICQVLDKSKQGGKIVFLGIGSSTPRGYEACIIKPKRFINPNGTVSEQRKAKMRNKKIAQENRESVSAFLDKVESILAKRDQPYTDLNGFFTKVNLLLDAPAFKRSDKWVYINSDGQQSTPANNKLDCNLFPSAKNICISGWKNKEDCGAPVKVLDPSEFIEYFETELSTEFDQTEN